MLRLFSSDKRSLKYHIEAKHNIDKNYKCNVCKKIFKTKKNLNYHIKTRHAHERSYKCDQCLSIFTHHMDLKQHMKVHTEGRYFCEVRATNLLLVIF